MTLSQEAAILAAAIINCGGRPVSPNEAAAVYRDVRFAIEGTRNKMGADVQDHAAWVATGRGDARFGG